MNLFLIALIVYLLIFVGIGIFDARGVKDFTDYSVAGKRQSALAVVMTLLATVVGASTTIGITDTVNNIGFPGIWWLMFGAIGLILQSFIISEKVRSTGADTLPDLAKITVGRSAELILSIIIVISWIGVIAGQLVAMNGLISFAVGKNSKPLFIIVSVVVIIYTLIGGQMSVVKTDKLQLIVIMAGIIICCIYLYLVKGGDTGSVAQNIELINKDYKPVNLFNQFFIIGGVYFLGPDIMSRNFLSKNESTAKRSALVAGIVLMVYSLIITLIGMWIRYNVAPEELVGSNALMYAVGIMPKVVGILLIFGLLSAILSSTDTCIINASTIFAKDILKKDSIWVVRATVAVIGAIAIVLAVSGRGDIMSLLTGAYSIYTPGVIFPLLIAILVYKKREIRKPVWIAAVAVGGMIGIISTYFSGALNRLGIPLGVIPYLTLIGMGLSLIISLVSVKWNKEDVSEKSVKRQKGSMTDECIKTC